MDSRPQLKKTGSELSGKTTRQEEVAGIRAKFPNKIPVIVERYPREKFLPLLDKTKFLVPQELTMIQFLSIIRSRLVLGATEALYLLVNNRSLVSMSMTMAEVYRDYKDEDGFVYMTYASQEMFGCLGSEQILPSSPVHVKNQCSNLRRDGPSPVCVVDNPVSEAAPPVIRPTVSGRPGHLCIFEAPCSCVF
ncbi:microtubule-associated protein 1 light chain 3 gamma [Vulpes vulpes]|uniref:Microtubule-associated protein 1 light chain 3 gamma n=1 Tax=Vulpes vulpes TaxID=9627 RepID=A0ABM4YHR7_VULVU